MSRVPILGQGDHLEEKHLPPRLSQAELDKAYEARATSLLSTIDPATDTTTASAPNTFPGLALWLKADALTLADGAAVATWADSSGNGRNASQGTAANQPTYHAAVLNGKPVVRFDAAASQSLTVAYGGEPATLFVVGKQNTANVYAAFCGGKGIGPGFIEPWYLRAQRSDGMAEFCRGNQINIEQSTLDPYVAARNRIPVGAFNIYLGTVDASSRIVSFYQDGYAQRIHSTRALTGSAEVMLIGAAYEYHAAGEFLTGDIAEVILFNRVLRDNELDAVGAYLAAKYAVTYTALQDPADLDAPLLAASFHYDANNKSETLHLLGSLDGHAFYSLNGVTPVYTCPYGELKDPSIRYDADTGWWYVAHSDAVNGGTTFGLARSRDLRTWETVGPVDMSGLPGVTQVWAPEWFEDPTTGIVHILFSGSTDNGATFAAYETHPTDDTYRNWSTPVLIGPTGTAAIDYFVVWLNNTYYMYFKGSAYPERYTASALTGPWTLDKSGNWGGWSTPSGNGYEGPSLVRFDGKWLLFTDDGHLKVSTSTGDYVDAPFTDFQQVTLNPAGMPVMNHGTVIRA